MGKIRVGIIGVGNGASSLVQGVEYYRNSRADEFIPGPMHAGRGGESGGVIEFTVAVDRLAQDADVVIIDTPGRDDEIAKAAILMANTLVTPMNDSFVDLDLIGQVDPETYKIKRPSFYAELIWQSRTKAASATGRSATSWPC